MYWENREKNPFVGYEYKEIVVSSDLASLFADCYENFGWIIDESTSYRNPYHYATIRLKRDRKIINKMELTRLQRHFEACVNEIKSLEQSKTREAAACSLTVGIVGTAFLAGSVLAIIHDPPIIWLCILLALSGFIGWVLPYFLYKGIYKEQVKRLQPLIEEKYEEVYTICEKGHALL